MTTSFLSPVFDVAFFCDEEDTRITLENKVLKEAGELLGKKDAAIEDLVMKYRELREWRRTLENIIQSLETVTEMNKFSDELVKTAIPMAFIYEDLKKLAPERLPYIDGGSLDDCQDVTVQSVVAPMIAPDEKEAVDQVVGNGPEYYGEFHHHKNEWQLVATEANYEAIVMRTQLYADENPNVWPQLPYGCETEDVYARKVQAELIIPKDGWGEKVETILNILWSNEVQILPEIGKGDRSCPINMSASKIQKILGPQEHGKRKKAHPLFYTLASMLRWMRDRNIISLYKVNGEWEVVAKVSKEMYRNSLVKLEDDWNLVPNKDKYLPLQYNRNGAWHPRIGVLFNGPRIPMFVGSNWRPLQKWNYEGKKQVFECGGIPFIGSRQLCPKLGTEYSGNTDFNYSPKFGSIIHTVFMRRLAMGKVKTCIKSEDKREKVFHWDKEQRDWVWEYVDTGIKYTRQAYWLCPISALPEGSFAKRFPTPEDKVDVCIVLFTDIIGEAYTER